MGNRLLPGEMVASDRQIIHRRSFDVTPGDARKDAIVLSNFQDERLRANRRNDFDVPGACNVHVRFLFQLRVVRLENKLETTDHAIERIASQVGFGSPTTFRDCFKHLVGTSPLAYRRAFRGTAAN